jgi:hypothetical protein
MQRYNPASVDCPGHVLLGLRMSFLEGGHWDCHVKECLVTNCVWMAISAKVATTTGLQCFLPASLCWPDLHVHKTSLPKPIPTAFTKYYVTSQRCPKQCPKNCVLGTFPTKQYFGNIHELLKMFQFATYRVSNMSQKASQRHPKIPSFWEPLPMPCSQTCPIVPIAIPNTSHVAPKAYPKNRFWDMFEICLGTFSFH